MGSLSHENSFTPISLRSVVYVKWNDAFSVAPSWVSFDEIVDEPALVESVGWLLPDSISGHIVLAQSVMPDSGDHILAIPVQMVVEMRTLFSCLLQ